MGTLSSRWGWLVAVFVAAAATAACGGTSEAPQAPKSNAKKLTADDYVAQARAAVKAGNDVEAIAKYRKALRLRADHYETLSELVDRLLATGQAAEATELTQAYFDAKPGDPRGYDLHARALFGAGNFAGAEDVLGQLVELDDSNAVAYNARARARVMQKKMPEAVADARKSVELAPGTVKFHIDLGSILQKSGNLGEAAIALRGALQLDDDNARAHLMLGVVLRDNYEAKEALSHHLKAARLAPDNDRTHFELGLTLFQMGDKVGAEDALARAVSLKSDDATNWYAYGQILRALEKYSKAHDAYRKAIEIDPKHPKAHRKLGYVLFKEGKLDEAEVVLTAALRQTPDDPYVYWDLAQVYRTANKLQLAVEAYESFVAKVGADDGDRPKAKKYIRDLKRKLRRRQR